MQNEMRKKWEFEIQQKKLQQFGQGGGVKRAGGGDLSHLIGSLAQRSVDKSASSKHQVASSSGRSLFARPGTSYPPPPTESIPANQPVQAEVGPQPFGQQQPYNSQQQPNHHPQQQPNHPQQQPNYPQQQQPYPPQQQPNHHPQQQQPNHPQQQPYLPQQQPNHPQQQPNHPQQQPYLPQQQPNHPQQQQQPNHPQQQPYLPQQQPNYPQQQPINHPQQVYHPQQQPNTGSTFGTSGTSGDGFGQVKDDDDFSDFQEAQPSISDRKPSFSNTSNQQGPQWSNQPTNQPLHLSSMPGQSSSSSSPVSTSMTSNMGWNNQTGTSPSSSWSMHGSVPTMAVSPSSSIQSSVFFTQSSTAVSSVGMVAMVASQRERADSQSSISSSSSSGMQAVQGIGTNILPQEGHSNMPSNMATYSQYSQGITATPPGSSRQMQGSFPPQAMMQGSFPPQAMMPGMTNMQHGMQPPGSAAGPTVMAGQQFASQQNNPGQVGVPVPSDDGGDVEEESEETKLEKLYGITIPDWCSQADNLPGIYKDVKEAATVNGATDTGTLYPILLASELPRDMLGKIWSRVNKTAPGQLNDMELRMMLGLVALGQTGLKVERLTLEKLASCKAPPIPSIPENVLKPIEGNWSFQKDNPQDSQADSTTLSLQTTFTNYQDQPSSKDFNSEPQGNNASKEGFTAAASWSLPNMNANSLMPQPITKHGELMSDKNKDHTLLSTSLEFQGFQSAGISSEINAGFGDFQGSDSSNTVITSFNTEIDDFSDFKSTPATNLAISLESLELKSVDSSLNDKVKPVEQPSHKHDSSSAEFGDFAIFSSAESSQKSSTTDTHVSHGSKNNNFAAFPVIKMPPPAGTAGSVDSSRPLTLKMPKNLSESNADKKDEKVLHISTAGTKLSTAHQDEIAEPVDKYNFLRDLVADESTVYSTTQPSRKKDNSFEDFEGFKQAETSADNDFGEFGDFQSTALPTSGTEVPISNSIPSDNWGFSTFNSVASQSSNTEPNFTENLALFSTAASNVAHTMDSHDDFGDFSNFESIQSNLISSGSSDIGGLLSLSNSTFKADTHITQLSGFIGSSSNGDHDSWKKSSNLVSSNFTNIVPLDSTQRYKQLCGDEEDADQHANAWGRCLNSCLLTLATCAFAVQTMSDPSIKQEVLQSKKGIEYFTAVIEVFKVTNRVQVSLMKTDFINEKLKDILEEINKTWKNIANFLTATSLESSLGKENFTSHHVQADEDRMLACGLCLLNVNKTTVSDSKLAYGGREYHSTCANFWCNRVDSILPSLWPVNSLI